MTRGGARRRARRGVVLAGGLLLALTGCTPPAQQYVAADGLGMYFALPVEWMQVPASQMTTAQSGWDDDAGGVFTQTVRWQAAWSEQTVNADQVFGASAPAKPVVWAFVRDLIEIEQEGIADGLAAALRDVVIPASSITAAGGEISVSRLRQGGFKGIHQLARYTLGGRDQTVEVTTMLSPDETRAYAVMIRCTTVCFDRHAASIGAVFDSLTFKETRGQ